MIVKSENSSQFFLESILLRLRKSGFLGSKKGGGARSYCITVLFYKSNI